MTIDNIKHKLHAAGTCDVPLERLQLLLSAARDVDELRSYLADLKGLTAAECVDEAHMKQTEVAAECEVTPMLVQQWVKRGRDQQRLRCP